MSRKPLIALLASLFAFPAAAINLPLPPEPPLVPVAPDVPEAPPAPPLPPSHLAAADTAKAYADDARRMAEDMRRDAEEMRAEIEAEMGALFAHRVSTRRVVKGQPYSAEVVTENRQTLADGNVISRKTVGHVYRDAEGRTRDETEARDGKARSIVLFDPVAGKRTVLLPDSKRAIVSAARVKDPSNHMVLKVDGSEVRIEPGRVIVNGQEVADGNVHLKSRKGRDVRIENGRVLVDGKEVGAAPGEKRVIVRREKVDGVPTEVVNVQVIRMPEGDAGTIAPVPPVPPVAPVPGVAPVPPVPPVLPGLSGALRFESTAHLGKGVEASLGTKDFDGVRAEGKSTTWTIPAGKIGNAKPIQVVSETWYSPELQVTVYSRYSDPRTGEAIYRLAAIKRGAPAAELFQVPAGYEVRDRGRAQEEILERAREARDKAREDRQRAREERDRLREEQRRKTG